MPATNVPDGDDDTGPRIMIVTGTITAKSGPTAGAGRARAAAFDPVTRTLSPGGGPELEVLSYKGNPYPGGAVIAAFPRDGALWVFDAEHDSFFQ